MRKHHLIAAATVLTVALAGCGSDETADTGGTTEGTSAASSFDPSSIAKDDTIAALVPEAVASTGELVFGSDTSYAPAEYIDDDGTTPVGYDVDIAKAIAAVLGLEARVESASFTGIIPAIGSKYDAGISSFTITAERMEQANMIAYFEAGEAYAVPAGNPGGVDPADLCGLTVGVQTGTVEDDALEGLIADCEAAGKDPIEPLRFPQQSDVTTALVGGKADLMYADSPIVAYAITQTGDQLEQLGDVFSSAPQGIVTSLDDPELTEAIQKALQKLMDDGDYVTILQAWGTEAGALTTAELNPAVD